VHGPANFEKNWLSLISCTFPYQTLISYYGINTSSEAPKLNKLENSATRKLHISLSAAAVQQKKKKKERKERRKQ
jgi:hypothetical protein